VRKRARLTAFSQNHGPAISESMTTASAMIDHPAKQHPLAVDATYYVCAVAYTVYMFYYYWTSAGGPVVLAMTMVPLTFGLFTLRALRDDEFYPKLPMSVNYLIAIAYCLFSIYCAWYMTTNYRALGEERNGFYNTQDIVTGALMSLLIIEYARKRHMPLFILNVIVILYAVYGYLVPGMFYHAGLTWHRVFAAASVEMETGIFARLPQLALTLIGSFLLVLSVLRGFGCIESLMRATKRVAVRSHHAIPQSSVIGSMAIGTVSGSGSANSITVGSATIPAMIQAGLPPATAAAIENASSMGGQLMPPVMGIAAFLMAEFLGVDYFDVVARGWVPALIYFASVSVSVYLLAIHYRTRMVIDRKAQPLSWRDIFNLGAFVVTVGGLIALMAALFLAPQFAALDMFCIVGAGIFLFHVVALSRPGQWSLAEFLKPLRSFLDSFIDMITDLTLLLATLSIMAGTLVITGVPTKLGLLLVDAAGVNMAAMVGMGFLFGVVLGTGLPPAPVYILVAIVIAPPFMQAGINPWVVHFFAFFVAVFGELTPPTSITAAITSKIANTSFYVTLWRSLQICVSLFTLMVGIFIHPELVQQPGLDQIPAFYLIGISTLGITFSLQGVYFENNIVDRGVRILLAAFSLVVLLSPNEYIGTLVSIPVLAAIAYWLLVRRRQLETGIEEVVIDEPSLATAGGNAPLARME
jgi:TRAP transporter 4TM/12TM fusion protein